MSARAGVLRSGEGLLAAEAELRTVGGEVAPEPGTWAWEAANIWLVSSALVAAALRREETRGSHWREDFPEPRQEWVGHLVTVLRDGGLVTRFEARERDVVVAG